MIDKYCVVENITEIPCAKRIVNGNWAYLHFVDGLAIYRLHGDDGLWHLYDIKYE